MQVLVILISFVALVVSVFSLYFQFLRPRSLTGVLGQYILFPPNPPHGHIEARFALDVIFVNKGSIPAVVRAIFCRLTVGRSNTEWLGFFERPDEEEPNRLLYPFVIPARGTLKKRVEFGNTNLADVFSDGWPQGRYKVQIFVITKRKPIRLRGAMAEADLPRTDFKVDDPQRGWVGQPLDGFAKEYLTGYQGTTIPKEVRQNRKDEE